jgi:hypothetical protein
MWVLYLLGVVFGIYIVSMVMENIDQSKRHKKFMHDMENFDKKQK